MKKTDENKLTAGESEEPEEVEESKEWGFRKIDLMLELTKEIWNKNTAARPIERIARAKRRKCMRREQSNKKKPGLTREWGFFEVTLTVIRDKAKGVQESQRFCLPQFSSCSCSSSLFRCVAVSSHFGKFWTVSSPVLLLFAGWVFFLCFFPLWLSLFFGFVFLSSFLFLCSLTVLPVFLSFLFPFLVLNPASKTFVRLARHQRKWGVWSIFRKFSHSFRKFSNFFVCVCVCVLCWIWCPSPSPSKKT